MRLNASGGETDDYFGSAVALDGDFALIGAIGDDTERGAAYMLSVGGQTGDDDADDMMMDDDGSMMIGGTSILGLSLISLMMMW